MYESSYFPLGLKGTAGRSQENSLKPPQDTYEVYLKSRTIVSEIFSFRQKNLTTLFYRIEVNHIFSRMDKTINYV